jgi:hypothetical protein
MACYTTVYFIGYGFELVNHHSGSDWWIKKIDSNGNEVTTGWNKKIDLNGTTSTTYDKPANAVSDTNNNIYISDGYFTIKFAPSGTEEWRKNTGGTLYLDSQNNIFIVTASAITKYNSSGTSLWSKPYTGKLAFDGFDNILVYAGDTIRYLTPGGAESWTQIAGDIDNSIVPNNGWYNSEVSSEGAEYWTFSAVSGQSYAISWNDRYGGDGTKTGYIYVSAYWSDDNSTIFGEVTSGWTSPKTFTASKNGTVLVKTRPNYYSGTYGISITDWYTNGASISNGWYNGSLAANSSYDYVVPVTQGKRYIVAWNDKDNGNGTKTGDVKVSATWQDDSVSIFSSADAGWTSPKSFIATKTGNVVVKIETYSSGSSYAGTYAVVVKEASGISSSRIVGMAAINSATFDSSGNIYVTGYGNWLINEFSKKDVWIKKYTSTGTEITSGWNKKFDWGHSDDEYATKILSDGTNIIVAGQGIDLINGASADDGWIKKYHINGSLVSELVIPDSNATLLRIDNNGNYYFSTDSSSYLRMRKYNSSGVLQFTLNDKSPYIYYPSFTFDTNNNIYISGYDSNLVTSLSRNDWVIKKFNSAGVEQ